MSEPSSHRSAGDWLLDLCVYAPIGFALEAHKYLPEFADRGRNQVAMARFVGKFAVDRLEQQFGPLGTILRTAPPQSAPAAEAADTPASSDGAGAPDPAAGTVTGTVTPTGPATDADTDVAADEVPDESSLALHGYGTLAASQIVPRLTTLDRADLEAIARFERANRGRRTILNRIEQLLAQR